MVTVIIK